MKVKIGAANAGWVYAPLSIVRSYPSFVNAHDHTHIISSDVIKGAKKKRLYVILDEDEIRAIIDHHMVYRGPSNRWDRSEVRDGHVTRITQEDRK